jgi:anaerobic magnesium-protoporphyrin IX monomethyl ester cyclase
MVDVLLIQPPIRDFYLTTGRTIPYGLACIASALREAGFIVQVLDCLATSKSRVIDLPPELSYLTEFYGKPDISPFALFHHFKHFGYGFEHIGQAARRSNALLVGISSLFTAYSEEAIRTAEAVKACHPGCRVVVGGHHATELPEAVMHCEAVDYVVRGEGEVSMPALARALKEGNSIESVPGIVFREATGRIRISAPAMMEDLDLYPPPALDLVNNRFYRRAKKGSAVVVASRGCPMRCSYCCVSASSHVKYRRRSLESVLREIEEGIVARYVRFIDFEDENISMEKRWFLELMAQTKARFGGYGLELRAMNGLFAPSLDEEVIRSMKEAGFRTLNLSLGTTSTVQQKRFNRPDVKGAFDDVLLHARAHGLGVLSYIIVGGPGQDPLESISDLLFLAERPVLAGVSIFYPSPGSADYRTCEEAGTLPAELSRMRATAVPISDTTTRKQSVTLLRLGRIVNYVKALLDHGDTIPEPAAYQEGQSILSNARLEMGRTLLRWFLHDGKIRGVTPEGEVFEHKTSHTLTGRFLGGLSRITVKGWAPAKSPNSLTHSRSGFRL